jgi:hypothetical protein
MIVATIKVKEFESVTNTNGEIETVEVTAKDKITCTSSECAPGEECTSAAYNWSKQNWIKKCSTSVKPLLPMSFCMYKQVGTNCDTKNGKYHCKRYDKEKNGTVGRCMLKSKSPCVLGNFCGSLNCRLVKDGPGTCEKHDVLSFGLISKCITILSKYNPEADLTNCIKLIKKLSIPSQNYYNLFKKYGLGDKNEIKARGDKDEDYSYFVQAIIRHSFQRDIEESEYETWREEIWAAHVNKYKGAGDLGDTYEERLMNAAGKFQIALQQEGRDRAHGGGPSRAYSSTNWFKSNGSKLDGSSSVMDKIKEDNKNKKFKLVHKIK